MNKKIKTLKKSVVERQISDDIKLEEEKDIKKEASTINTKENSIKSKVLALLCGICLSTISR